MKKCNRCGETKDIKDFHIDNEKKDFHKTICKDCINKYSKEDLKMSKVHGAKSKGGVERGKQRKIEALRRLEIINKFIPQCIKINRKIDYFLLSELTNIPKSTIYRLIK